MDRISALRNVEEALSEFEAGESDLATMERRVRGVLRTYATEFAEQDAYRASGSAAAEGVVVLAASPSEALSPSGEDAVEKRELLGETMSDAGDLR